MNTTMIFLKPLDWITCCCYMMLRKFHYPDWDAKYTAILNTCFVCTFPLNALIDIIIKNTPYQRLYILYTDPYPYVKCILTGAIILFLLCLRYYHLRKEAIPNMEERLKRKGWDKGFALFVVVLSVLIISFCISLFVTQYIIA